MFSKVSYVVAYLFLITSFTIGSAQESVPRVSPDASGGLQKQKSEMSAEEKAVRAAYEKLTKLNQAALYRIETESADLSDETKFLKFELRNFRVGPIQEILGARYHELITRFTGDTIRVYRSVSTHNNSEQHVAYEANWTTGQYASMADPNWTIGEVLALEARQYHDVGRFALYDVKVSFQGKFREYRALALFHNPYGSVETLKPTFWDSVGAGGVLTQVWSEKRPARSHKLLPQTDNRTPAKSSIASPPARHHARMAKRIPLRSAKSTNLEGTDYWTASYLDSVGEIQGYMGSASNTRDHVTGLHGLAMDWKGSCASLPANTQYCRVDPTATRLFENGTTATWPWYHKYVEDDELQTATGTRGTPIRCHHGHGMAVHYCLLGDCNVSGSISGSGFSMRMEGGDVWNGIVVHEHTCNLPSSGGACTNTWTMQKCFSLGEDWDELTCKCAGTSPVIIDVNGDGFSLTNKAAGVSFDINADGQPEQIGWTANGSDDAWLFLDRNGNGVVDNGRELFGNFTPQPSSDDPNGFIALAEYDKPASGGNNDGVISSGDIAFASLRLWRDANHNGISEAAELRPLAEFGIEKLEIDYKDSRRTDEYGNRFLYRAKVKDAQGQSLGRWAWDVFLVH